MANDFGVISPNSKTTSVNTPVDTPTNLLPNKSVLLTPAIWFVDKLSNGIFFILRVDRESATNQMTEGELRTIVDVSVEDGVFPSSAKERRRCLFTVVNAVSAEEKNAESKIKITIAIICKVESGSKKLSS